ncbi:aspartate aminotransferase family protein [Candidatus Bathyarchaeota archaeon]|nr:aspartate aminotransferase family protein [Candidatus Bathyarchaeota archaeon]
MSNLYWKRGLVASKGQGSLLWDLNGKEYIDCTSNYGVAIVGHCHPKVVEAVKLQTEQLMSCHGAYFNEARSKFLEKLNKVAPKELTRSFLSNSGTEAVEFAFKLAKKKTGKTEIIAMMNAFHGKSMGALSATWKKKYKEGFGPMLPGFKHAPYGNIQKINENITSETAAIIVEPIQGEGGINVPPQDFLKQLREICDEKNILLIFDEIQTGMGRTGKMFACQHSGVTPDIMCISKGVASGLPLGVTMSKEEVMSAVGIGDHSSTFGGGPIQCAAGAATIDVLVEEKLPEKAMIKGKYIFEKLHEMSTKYKTIRESRGMGLMIGVELRFEVINIMNFCQERGVLTLEAGRNILRLLPSLVITQNQIDKVLNVLNESFEVEESERFPR